MPGESENVPFWERQTGVPVPASLTSAAQAGKINEGDYNEAVGLLGEANIPLGAENQRMAQEKVARLEQLLKGSGLDENEIQEIFRLAENI